MSYTDGTPEQMDSRDLIQRLDELESELDTDELDDDDRELLDALRELADVGIEDWQYGAQLIREDCFEDHARQLADDIGAVDANASWPNSYIDWEAAAEALQQDYTSVEFLGTTYYVR